jgi:hypothetical protein
MIIQGVNDANIYDVHVVDDIHFSKEGMHLFLKKIVWFQSQFKLLLN